jgi:chemotaxis signal transduction protein
MNVRGELRSVADGRRILATAVGAVGDSGFVLMLRRPGQEIGLKVDDVDELREIRREDLTHSGKSGFAQGIASGAVVLLDVDAVLASVFSRGSV